jgi:hypothetical protein
VCAGPNPAGTATNQQIALYGVPPRAPLVPTGTATVAGQTWTTVTNAANALAIGEQSGILNASIAVTPRCGPSPGQIVCSFGSGSGNAYGSMRLDFPPGQFSLPANTKLEQVKLHASYNQSSALFDSDYSPEFMIHQYQNPAGWKCTADMTMPASHVTSQFWKSVSSCLDATRLASGFSIEWRARVWATCVSNTCGAAQTRTLDGIEIVPTLDPVASTTAVVMPQDGCIAPIPDAYESNSGASITGYGTNPYRDIAAPECAVLMWDAVPRTIGTTSQIGCYSGQVSIQGTVYAPGAAVDFDQAGPEAAGCSPSAPSYTAWSYPIFGRGAVVRTLRVKGFRDPTPHAVVSCGNANCGGVVQDRVVTFQATIAGTTKVEARVRYPAAGGSPVVEYWNVP